MHQGLCHTLRSHVIIIIAVIVIVGQPEPAEWRDGLGRGATATSPFLPTPPRRSNECWHELQENEDVPAKPAWFQDKFPNVPFHWSPCAPGYRHSEMPQQQQFLWPSPEFLSFSLCSSVPPPLTTLLSEASYPPVQAVTLLDSPLHSSCGCCHRDTSLHLAWHAALGLTWAHLTHLSPVPRRGCYYWIVSLPSKCVCWNPNPQCPGMWNDLEIGSVSGWLVKLKWIRIGMD